MKNYASNRLTFQRFWPIILIELTLRIRNLIAIRNGKPPVMDDRWFQLFLEVPVQDWTHSEQPRIDFRKHRRGLKMPFSKAFPGQD